LSKERLLFVFCHSQNSEKDENILNMRMLALVFAAAVAVLFGTTAWTFQALPMVANRRAVAARMSVDNENAITKIQEEYRQMREELQQGLEGVKDIDPVAFTEELLQKAADMAALQRYQQEEIILDAEKELRHAEMDRVLADAREQQAHAESVLAQEQVEELEAFEDEFEDQERLRDLSVAHAAAHIEHDARDLSIESQFHELEASEKKDRAEEFLRQLEGIEAELKETIKTVLKYKNEHAMKEWAKAEAVKHKDFIDNVKTKLKSIDHDPFKGDIAF
jgi:hypothetical protein